ncbi:MAG: type II toxin-antitoxin system RelE/ParE family toxin [Gammaproteobacteria bacterium]|nr:type II toxin-antitoxin system RelE/ParE family toxin [Gammaproteobacteria bacterium]
MAAVTFSPQARQDLLDIGDYIAKDNRANARRFVGKLIDQCRQIRGPISVSHRARAGGGTEGCPAGELFDLLPLRWRRRSHRAGAAWRAGLACRARNARGQRWRHGAILMEAP